MATSPSPPQRRRGETRVSINCDLRDVEAAARVWNPAFFSPPVSPRSAYEGSLVSPSSGKQCYLALVIFASVSQFYIYLLKMSRCLFSIVSINQEKALVWTISVIVKSLRIFAASSILQARGCWCPPCPPPSTARRRTRTRMRRAGVCWDDAPCPAASSSSSSWSSWSPGASSSAAWTRSADPSTSPSRRQLM